MGLNSTGFNQVMINNGPSHGGLLPQGGQPQPGQMMNGGLGPDAGRVRAAGVGVMQYQGASMQGAAAGAGGAGSALAETLTQGGQQMGAHTNLNGAQQAGNMNKVGDIFPVDADKTNITACITNRNISERIHNRSIIGRCSVTLSHNIRVRGHFYLGTKQNHVYNLRALNCGSTLVMHECLKWRHDWRVYNSAIRG